MSTLRYVPNVDEIEEVDQKIEKILEYMLREATSKAPDSLRRILEMRRFCLSYFQNTDFLSRKKDLWERYFRVTREIDCLRKEAEKETRIRCNTIEKELEYLERLLPFSADFLKETPVPALPACEGSFEKNRDLYEDYQRRLVHYSRFAKKLNEEKEEIFALRIPFQEKQRLLDRIHCLSDVVFPKKRELLSAISHRFSEDLQSFVRHRFPRESVNGPPYLIRKEIQELQSFAKNIFLNATVFSQSREKLSHYWNQIKERDKKNKKPKEERKSLPVPEEKTVMDEKLDAFDKHQRENLSTVLSYYRDLFKEITNESEEGNLRAERSLDGVKESIVSKILDMARKKEQAADFLAHVTYFKGHLKEDNERYRRALSASNQSIEKAMAYNELLVNGKNKMNRLEALFQKDSSK